MIQTIQENYSKVIIKSDSLIAIQAINEKFIPLSHICILVKDINMLTEIVEKISFVYCRRFVKETYRIAKETTSACNIKSCY